MGKHQQLHSTLEQDSYAEWRKSFAFQRLRSLYLILLIVNPVFILSEWFLYKDYFTFLLSVRAILELGWLSGLLLLVRRVPFLQPVHHLIFLYLFTNIGISLMTLILGGFRSSYYQGLNLAFLGSAVILPAWLIVHLVCMAGSLTFYYGVNSLFALNTIDVTAAVESGVFFLCTAMIVFFCVYLYERLHRAEFEARSSERQARQDLEESNKKLRKLDRLKSEFFANISHELRTPLTLSLGAFKSLKKLTLTSESQNLIQTGLRNLGGLLFLINELLDLARFESGRVELKKQSINVVRLLRDIAGQFESSHTRRIHFRGFNEPVILEADAKQLKKVFTNLLANAFKFTEAPDPQVWVRLQAQKEWVEVEVEDNGIGIPPEHLAHIFDRFTQVEGSATRRYEGSGIGLAVVKEIVAGHGGSIRVESEPGRGSTFTVTLPRGNPGSLPDPHQLEKEDEYLVPLSKDFEGVPILTLPKEQPDGPLVLVVEDNPDMQRYVSRILSAQYRVAVAKDGVEGLEQARALQPALILTDMMMPRMSGADLLAAIRGDAGLRATPVIFLTARAGTEARVESLEAGADDYIAKPFEELEMLARVANLLRLRQQERTLRELEQEKLRGFLPSQLGEMLLTDQAEDFMKPHRAEITVLFIDLRGFTAFAGSAQPEEILMVLQEYHTEIGQLIAAYQGTTERLIGDAIMAYLNDPVPVPNHPEQGIRLGLAMLERMERLSREWTKRGYDLGAGVGLASGYATLGVLGFEGRKEYSATGPVSNLAARLSAEAQRGQLLVSEATRVRVESLVQAHSVGPLDLKGINRQVTAYHVTGLKS